MDRFDRVFWRRLWALARPFWFSEERRKGRVLLAILLVLGAMTIALSAYFTFILRDSTQALVNKDPQKFYHEIELFFAWFVGMVPVAAYYPWLIGRLTIVWREWMTRQFIALGFGHRSFYRMSLNGQVDNPDQRISEDINSFAGGTLIYFLIVLGAIVTAVTFFGILWSISPFLSIALVIYAAVGSYLSVVIGRRLIGINFDQQRYEADFRFGLVHVRDNVEPIFMYGGEQHETEQLGGRFANVVRNFNLLIRWQRHLAFVTASYSNLISLLPYVLLAGTYFAGKMEYGQIVQAASAFGSLQGALSLIVSNFQGLSSYACVVNRLATYVEECEAARAADLDGAPRIETVEGDEVAFDDVTVLTPDRRKTLVSGLSMPAHDGQPILLRGRSGVGKTSLLRALAGIWRDGDGKITRPPLSDVMFLPQRPYMILGTLRDQICYPHASGRSDAEVNAILAQVNLEDLPERFGGLDAEMNWADVLSPGEQQRLAFARLLLNRPRYAFLDEATSALDLENESKMYELLAASGIRFLSTGHRPSLLRYHRSVLDILGPRDWKLAPSAEIAALPAAT
jgi:vitamin B12/bleomycin/antimicrobial peptide transport system ATP-binding/permease protein